MQKNKRPALSSGTRPVGTLHVYSVVLLMVFGLWTSGKAEQQSWMDNGITWGGEGQTVSGYYRPGDFGGFPQIYDGLPNSANSTPTWTQAHSGGSVNLDTNQGYLNITTASGQARSFRSTHHWDASVAATLEITLRVNSAASNAGAASLVLGNANRWTELRFGLHADSGDLTVNGTRLAGITAGSFNTLRVTLDGMDDSLTSILSLYVNQSSEAAFVTSTFNTNVVQNWINFGDTSTSSAGVSGSTDWASVKWLSGVAVAPIPEPGTIAIFIGVMIGIIWIRGRR